MYFAHFRDESDLSYCPYKRTALFPEVMLMRPTRWSTIIRTSVLASSLLVLPLTLPTFAQMRETTPAPAPQVVETRDHTDNRGLWGLLGLAGLAGLIGRRRHVEPVNSYSTPRERSKV